MSKQIPILDFFFFLSFVLLLICHCRPYLRCGLTLVVLELCGLRLVFLTAFERVFELD
jgi:hypothetical protein